ncbi:MAG: phosphoribosyltransferase family protein [Bacteroidota bacterium]
MKTTVLNARQIEQKLDRIAYEILENNFDSPTICFIGIQGNGDKIAEELARRMQEISDIAVNTSSIHVDKTNPLGEAITLSTSIEDMSHQTLVLVDDVINSGRTMQYALRKLLEIPTERIKTVALVDRKHRKYPIRVDYVGLTLSTTLQDRVEVTFEDTPLAYLV